MNLNYTTQTIQHLSIPQALDNIKHDLLSRTIGRFLGQFEIKVQPIYIYRMYIMAVKDEV